MADKVQGIALDTKELDKILTNLRPRASGIVNKWGWKITTRAATVHPWKTDTGSLMNSLLSESHMQEQLLFILQDGVEYGIFLELGTSKMAAYPFVIPALEWGEKGYIDAFKELFT